MDLELGVDIPQVEGNCVDADAEFGGGRLVMMALYKQSQHLGLLWCELVVGPLRRPDLSEQPDHLSRNFRRHPDAPAHNASKIFSSSSYTVKASSVMFGNRSLSRRIPSIPDIPGSPMSTSTASGTTASGALPPIRASASSIDR